MSLVNCTAVINRRCKRLFRKDVLSRRKAGKNAFLVVCVRRKDHDPVNAGRVDRFFAASADFRIRGLPELHTRFRHFDIGIIDRHDFHHPFRVTEKIRNDMFRTLSVSDHRHTDLFSAHSEKLL